ncbi:MAG: agmatine deiminase family protein [Pseudobdellovibrionaceae bacterium]
MNMNYIMPAEWQKHRRTWLAWPHHKADWPQKFAPIPWVFAEIVRLISVSEKVGLLVKDLAAKKQAQKILSLSGVNLNQVDFIVAATDRGWMRDCGGIYVRGAKDKKPYLLNWGFNAWAKYSNYKKDAKVPEVMAKTSGVKVVQPTHGGRSVVLEGGSIEVNGAGVLITTEECLLSDIQCRNPGLGRADYEQIFAQYLGIKKTIWLGNGIVGDDTHGHVDDIARFTDKNTIVAVLEKDRKNKNYSLLQDNWRRLQQARNLDGQKFKLLALPMPRPVLFEDQPLPASYANFLITNQSVIVPLFNDPADAEALNVLQQAFPGRQVVGLYARDLILGLGTVHCLTQQEPVL